MTLEVEEPKDDNEDVDKTKHGSEAVSNVYTPKSVRCAESLR